MAKNAWNPRVAVVGAGAMGSLFGGLLSEGGLDVTLVDPWKEHIDRIHSNGLRITGHAGERNVSVGTAPSAGGLGIADIVLVQCKALHTDTAVRGAKSLFGPKTIAITFQNGLGNEEVIGNIVGMEKVLGGLTVNGSNIVEPGIVRSYSSLPSYIGELSGGISERVKNVAEVFSAAGLATVASADIMREKWRKLFANVALSAISAITNLNTRVMMSVPELKAIIDATIDEAITVARAAGQKFTIDEARAVLVQIVNGGAAAENKSSACIDILNKRKTEVDFINGSIVRLGEKYNIGTPINRTLVAAVKGLEKHYS